LKKGNFDFKKNLVIRRKRNCRVKKLLQRRREE
jgi:hypothetical protein